MYIFLGSNTPKEDLISFLKEIKPVGLAISVTMIYNLGEVHKLVHAIRKDADLKDLHILLGGNAVDINREIVKQLENVTYAEDLYQAISITQNWK
jgi:methanogenic corrinoid protein MtbC1